MEETIKYEDVCKLTKNMLDFVKNHLLEDENYVAMYDKVFLRKLKKMSIKDRQEKFEFMMESEGNETLCLFLTHSYLANIHKHSGRMDYTQEEKAIPIIEEMLKD